MNTATLHSEKKKTLIPQLRFQEFDGEWKEVKLGDYIKIKSGNSPSSHNFIDNGSYPFIKVEELNNCNKYQNTSRFYSNEKKNLVETFSVIFPKRGAAILNNKVRINDCPILMDSNMMAITPLRSKLNYEFLYYKIVKEELYKIADTSTIPQINNKHIEPYILFIASLPEQQKIASFLSAVDEKTQQLSRKKELLSQYKKGVMQQLFSGKLRFKDENGKDYPDWEEKKLGEVCEKIGDGLHGTPIYSKDSDIYFINGNNLINGKIEITEKTKKVDYNIFTKNDKRLNANTILMSLNGTIGNISKYNNEKVMLGKSVGYFNFKENADFYFHFLKTEIIQNFFTSELTGSTIKNLSLKTLRETEISLPCIEEQQKIATFLSSIDTKIESTSQQIIQTQSFKKGLLQQMFV